MSARAALNAALLPLADQTLLLRASLLGGEPARAAWATWRSRTADPKRALAVERGGFKSLVPLLLHGLEAAGAEVEPALLPYLRAARVHEELRARRYREILAEALAILASEDVPAIVLGGAALAEAVYPDPALRHGHGLDLLIRPADLGRAGHLLASRGFRRVEGMTAGAATFEHASRLRADLRTALFDLPYYGTTVGTIWDRSRPQGVAGRPSRVLSSVDALVHACGHASYSAGRRAPVWACDAWLLIRRAPDLGWDAVVACAIESRLALPMSPMLRYLAEALAARVPASCTDALDDAAEATGVVGREVALHGVLRADPDGLPGLMRHARGWGERARVARFMLWPAPDYFSAIGQSTDPGLRPIQRAARPLRYLAHRTKPTRRTGPPRATAGLRARWPDEDRELVLRAALFHGTSAVDAWSRLRARRDPEQVHVVAWELRPLLYANLRRLGVRDPLVDAFKAVYRATWVRNEKSVRHLGGVLASLRDAGVETVLLKGGALALQYYGDLGLRPMGDLDILVRPACARDGIAALERLGWSCRYSLSASFLAVKHAAPFEDADGCNCDLHWRVFEEYCPPEADAEFWAAAVESASPTVPARTLSPADQLLHVCVHGTKWAETPGLRWIADAVHVLRAGGIDWERFARQAVVRRFTLEARDALAYLRARLDAPVPAAVLTRLAGLPVSRLERLEFLLRQRPHRVLGELPLYWCNYLRSVEGGRIGHARGFLRYLQQAWELPSIAQVPRAMVARAVPRLAGALRRAAR